ncbi:MAG TPA: hypothetical protein VFK59_10900 [Actinomycetota bacterium]|nr:hypothetical protein [Actinomycetota bacterium]
MSDYTKLFERAGARYEPPDLRMEGLLKRRDRKRRNQRIAAGSVGITVFAAAVLLVTTVGSFDRTQTPMVPGGAGTGPVVTGPAETPTVAPDAGWHGLGIPPEEVALSTPAEGELIGQFAEIHVGFLFVYADGRVIWKVDGLAGGDGRLAERRLTPEGVNLVRSGAIQAEDLLPPSVLHGVPASAWADAESRPYAPPRYALCFARPDGDQEWPDVDPSHAVDLLPTPAQALLRGKEPRWYEGAGAILAFLEGLNGDDFPDPPTECLELATEEARALDGILSDAGVERHVAPDSGDVSFVLQHGDDRIWIGFNPLFPHGLWHWMGG